MLVICRLSVPLAASIFRASIAVAEPMTVGAVDKVQAQVEATQAGQTRGLVVKSEVYFRDRCHSREGARLQATLKDGTQLTLGENATVVVDRRPQSANSAATSFNAISRRSSGWRPWPADLERRLRASCRQRIFGFKATFARSRRAASTGPSSATKSATIATSSSISKRRRVRAGRLFGSTPRAKL